MKEFEKAVEISKTPAVYGTDFDLEKTIELQRYNAAMLMAQWKDKEIKEILLAYTKWLDKRGFFKEELQCDFPHQIETFLEIDKEIEL